MVNSKKLHIGAGLSREAQLPVASVEAAGARFWAKVDKNGPVIAAVGTPCWLWRGYRKNGYGSLSICDYDVYAHRLAFVLEYGRWPGENACHRCDVRHCVRPDHLFDAPQSGNIADAKAKGRTVDPPVHLGEAHPKATLTDAEVAEIRSAVGPQRALAAKYRVSQSTVWRIRHRHTRARGTR